MPSKFCILVPLYNEAEVVQSCLQAIKRAKIDLNDVYLVDDGSTDETSYKVLATTFPISNLLLLGHNRGKSKALAAATLYFKLRDNYQWVGTMDADTLVSPTYGTEINKLISGAKPEDAAFCGHVQTDKDSLNPFVRYRSLEYFLTHYIYKQAQGRMGVITVLPGCTSLIRSEIFHHLTQSADPNMLTEDMDWTIRIHKENLGNVRFASNLTVQTQDPKNLRDYLRQIHRWYRGLGQVYKKHQMYKLQDSVSWELSFLTWEGLIYGTLWLAKMILVLAAVKSPMSNKFLQGDLCLFAVYTFIIALLQRNMKSFLYLPLFYPIRMLNSFVFLWSMVEIFILRVGKSKPLSWNKVDRYKHVPAVTVSV